VKILFEWCITFGESQMINRHILEHHIDLKLDTNLVEIISDDKGHVKAILTDKGETIECQIVGLTAGVSPNIDFLKESGIELEKEYLLTDFRNQYQRYIRHWRLC
jgi:NADPH-dependent 2,4-dienoyl-CoA reductase/sulfur reductase-like enzyme